MSFHYHTRTLLHDAIEGGVECGLRRAFKHTDTPTFESMVTSIMDNVILALDEKFEITNHDEAED